MPRHVERDRIGPLDASVYRVQTEDLVELAVTRLDPLASTAATPVVLVHGTFCQRSFWVSDRGLGLGPHLRERGYDVWIPEVRGHGRSPRDRRFPGWSAEDQLRWDLPVVQRLVAEQTSTSAHWVGHSWGGTAILASLAAGWLDSSAIRSAVVLGANISEGDEWLARRLRATAARMLLALLGRVPARLFRLGPEPESRAYMLDFYRWKGRTPCWETQGGRSYWEGVRGLDIPLLAFAAADDHNDPPSGCRTLFEAVGSADKEYVLLGRQEGFEKDYQHLEMVVSKEAAREVYPRITAWLDRH
jgi:pimeloyl-ACP methyl ester carboxylesterase